MRMASVAKQLDEYRPDMPSTASFGLQELFQQKLTAGRVLDPNRSDIEVLYEKRVKYLMEHPEDISLNELAKAATPKERVEVSAGDEFCRLMASFNQRPVQMVDGVEVIDPK